MDFLFEFYYLPLDEWIQSTVLWLTSNLRPFFQAIKWPVAHALEGIEHLLVTTSPSITLIALILIIWQFATLRIAIFSALAMIFLGFIGLWEETMTTLAIIVTSVIFCIAIGIPLGIWSARNDRVETIMRPILDVMQTMPGFVYLIPVVMLIGIGNISGVIVTIVFALPPVIRLTNLGIREVRPDLIEAAYAFGSSPNQVLFKCQIPLAMKTIMAGVNQTLMLALSMVVIAALIGAGGLGLTVYVALGRLDIGAAVVGGTGIVILAIILDRITQKIIPQDNIKSR